MFRRTSTRILSVLLTLMLLLGCRPGNPAAAALETEHAHEFLLAEAQAHDHEHDHDHGTDGCACFDCACADCACEDCGDCGDCRCEDCACEDCGDCACGHAHAHGCACGDAEPDDVPERALDQGPGITDRYGVPIRQKLAERVREALADNRVTADEGRLLTEVALFADRVAIDEELVRLHTHFAAMREMLTGEGPVGRRLDFLLQEINREANTIGSKCNDAEVAGRVVEIKYELEKMREQIQNLE